MKKFTHTLRKPMAAAAALLMAAEAPAGLAGPVGHSQNDRPVPFAAGLLGHGANESPVPVAAGLLGHSNNESPVPAADFLGHSCNEHTVPVAADPIGHGNNSQPIPLTAGRPGHGQNDGPMSALLWTVFEPRSVLASPGEDAEDRGVAELLDRSSAMPADLDATHVLRPYPGGAVPAAPVPAPGAVSLLGLALLAGKRRRRSG